MHMFKSALMATLASFILSYSVQATSLSNNVKLKQAIASDQRSSAHKARDKYRHPLATLTFFGLTPNMTVVEMIPGGGWYTEILAATLKGSGTFYAANYPDTGKDDYYSKTRRDLVNKFSNNSLFSEVKISDFNPKKVSAIAPQASADLVLTFRNLHNWGEAGMTQFFKDAYTALKPNGVLGVVEHRMPAAMKYQQHSRSGYVPQALVIKLAKQAGFKLVATSEINANPKDDAMHPAGVWTLPPVFQLGDKDHAKYLAIGESDRMTLKFVKPVMQ